MKAILGIFMMVMLIMPSICFAQEAAEAVKPVVEAAAEVAKEAPKAVEAAKEVVKAEDGEDIAGLLQGIIKVIGDWKNIGWQAGLAALLMLLLGTMKNSLLRKWLWDKIPQWGKVLVAPILSIIIFALGMPKFGGPELIAALTTGAAAVYLHQLVKGLSEAPFVGGVMKSVLEFVAKLLKKPEEKKA